MNDAPSLLELQNEFAAAMLGRPPGPLAAWVVENGLAAPARLRVYRQIVTNEHIDALRTTYPAVARLMGEQPFDAAATRYLRDRTSASGNLQDYGAGFADFLAGLEELETAAYLPDVARLEWARQAAYLAADGNPVALEALAAIPQSMRPALYLTLHPAVRLVRSAYPILDIWLFCQKADAAGLELGDVGQQVLVWREAAQTAVQAIGTGLAVLTEGLLAGRSLGAAYREARRAETQFEPGAGLRSLFESGMITGVSTPVDTTAR